MDEIDCVAMDQFQKDFFFIRQAEYLPYTNSLGPGLVKQGDLSDAYYFDFISFAQYSTIFRDITIDPPMVFEEQQPIIVGEDEKQQFIAKVIKRDPSLDNSKLAQRHDELVGEKILDKLNETFAQTASAIPSIQSGSSSINEIQASKLFLSVPLRLWFAPAYRHKTDPRDLHFHEFEAWQMRWLLEKTGWTIIDEVQFTNPTKKLGIRPLLRLFTPRYLLIYAQKS